MFAVRAYGQLIFQDESGSTGMLQMSLTPDVTYADADSAMTALSAAVQPLTGAVLVKQRIVYKALDTSLLPAALGSSVKRNGLFFIDTDPPPGIILAVPGILDDLLITVDPLFDLGIDITDSRVTALLAVLVSSGATDPFGNPITGIAAGYVQSRV